MLPYSYIACLVWSRFVLINITSACIFLLLV